MTIKLYNNSSDKVVVDKNITQQGSDVTGTLRDDCSIIDPIIKMEAVGTYLLTSNYAYISEFGRYYYITNIVCTGKLFEVHMHVDVLMSYKSAIRSNRAVISRQQYNYNLYLQDGVFKTEAYPHYEIRKFPSGFTQEEFVLCVAGA